jgi:hypothetical protein
VSEEPVERLPSQPGVSLTVAGLLARVDEGWSRFWALASRYPPERMDERIGNGWSRKQMLAHVAAWHENAADRLLAFAASGDKQPLHEDEHAFNGRVARVASGRTAGEILHAVESSYRRLHRQVELLTDEQMGAHEGWPAGLIAANTWEHYEEHAADLNGAAP